MKGCKAFIKHFSDTKKNCEHKNLPKFSLFKFQLPQRVRELNSMIEILQRFYKLVILGTLGMTRYGNQQWYYQLEENFDAHLHAKSETYPSPLS